MDKHAFDFGGLVGASHPAFDTAIGAPTGRAAHGKGREVAGGKAHQRVSGVERRDQHFAHRPFGHGVAAAWGDDFQQNAFVDNQPCVGLGFVGNQAQICRGIALAHGNATGGKPITQAGWQSLAGHQSLAECGQGNAHAVSFFEDDFEEGRRAGVGGCADVAHRHHLLLGLPHAGWKHRTAQGACAAVQHKTARGKVVREGVMHHIPRPKTSGIQRTTQPPKIIAETLGFVNRPRRGKHACRCASGEGGIAPKRRLGGLLGNQSRFAGDRQGGQGRQGIDCRQVDARQQGAIGRAAVVRPLKLGRQPRQLVCQSVGVGSGFECVKMRHGAVLQGGNKDSAGWGNRPRRVKIYASQRLRRR